MTSTGAPQGSAGPAAGMAPVFAALPGQTRIKDEFHTLIWSEPLPGGGRQVIKMYRRQPFYETWRRWFLPCRSEWEHRVLARLLRHGIAGPEPLWWRRELHPQYGRCDLLATRENEGAIALDLLLQQTGATPDLAPVFRLLRRLHDLGVSHGALMPRNILVSLPAGGPPAFQLIDFARSRQFPGAITGTRVASFDLRSLLHAVRGRIPVAQAPGWLAAYGLADAAARRLLRQTAGHRPGRPWRHLRRMEIDIRLAAARLGHALGRRVAPNP